VRNIDLSFIISKLAAPAIMGLSLTAAVPYVLAELVTTVFGRCSHLAVVVSKFEIVAYLFPNIVVK